ncbi:uncharacterized protein V2V93DRAFT_375915 [Kockiozyma suomiensis]|uniref:uncharacterized protein n=1 Tax=Kockiozyma suomiensis TaxID=1337062 RepID=UPI0033441D3F
MTKLLVTGASGFVGGAALNRIIASDFPGLDISVFLRRDSQVAPILAKYPGKVTAKVGKAGYTDPVFADLVKQADIVLHAGHSADETSPIDVFTENLKDGALLIHTSGTYILTDFTELDKPTSRVYDDEQDIKLLTSWPIDHPHRNVESKVLNIHKLKPAVNSIIVSPPIVYGISTGPISRTSKQIPKLPEIADKVKANRLFGTGLANWSNIHINDLADFFEILLATYLQDPSKLSFNDQGYYFVEGGEHVWKKLISALDEPLVKYKVIDSQHTSEKLPSWTLAELSEVFGAQDAHQFYEVYRSSSRSKATKARKLGWQPKEKDIYSTLDETVNVYLNGLSD